MTVTRKSKDFLKKVPGVLVLYRLLLEQHRAVTTLFRKRLGKRSFVRHDFESIFDAKADPWNYAGAHQRERFQLLLETIPEVGSILEIGCAEGMFTRILTKKSAKIVALDISQTALQRARKLCGGGTVDFVQADMLHLPLHAQFDAVVCAGVLVYLPETNLLEAASDRIVSHICEGGYLILENMWRSSGGAMPGAKIHDHFLKRSQLQLRHHQIQYEYGISVFQKVARKSG